MARKTNLHLTIHDEPPRPTPMRVQEIVQRLARRLPVTLWRDLTPDGGWPPPTYIPGADGQDITKRRTLMH